MMETSVAFYGEPQEHLPEFRKGWVLWSVLLTVHLAKEVCACRDYQAQLGNMARFDQFALTDAGDVRTSGFAGIFCALQRDIASVSVILHNVNQKYAQN